MVWVGRRSVSSNAAIVGRTREGKLNFESAMMRMRNRGAIQRGYARVQAFSRYCDRRVK